MNSSYYICLCPILIVLNHNALYIVHKLQIDNGLQTKFAMRMLANKRGSLIGAVLAVSIGILVIHVNFVIFQGIYDAIIRDMTDYRFGDIYVTHEEDSTIERSHLVYTNWFERVPIIQAATPRAVRKR